jgi:hypothetical protein
MSTHLKLQNDVLNLLLETLNRILLRLRPDESFGELGNGRPLISVTFVYRLAYFLEDPAVTVFQIVPTRRSW